jgi:hypothetical protein
MAALILPLISNKNGAVYDSTVGVISRLLQSDVAKAGDPQRASEILVRVVKREHLPYTCRKQCATAYCAPVWTPEGRESHPNLQPTESQVKKWSVCRRFTRMLERDGRLGPADQ